jgi:hypothetical protein
MPKTRRSIVADSRGQATANEMTIRAYDRRMRERFEEATKALTILLDVSGGRRAGDEAAEARATAIVNACFGRDIFADLREHTVAAQGRLRELIMQYDLAAAPFIVVSFGHEGRGGSGGSSFASESNYFALMSCENLDSFLWDICAQMHSHIGQIQDIMGVIEGIHNPGAAKLVREVRERERGTFTRSARVSRVSAAAKRAARVASFRGTFGPKVGGGSAAPKDAFMSAPCIQKVLAERQIGAGADIFSQLRRTLHIADESIVRTMNWSHAIRHMGEDGMICENCSARVRVLQDMSEAVCDKCGRIAMLVGAPEGPDDGGTYGASTASSAGIVEPSRSRRGGYNYMRHLKIWLDRLQAIENYEFDADDIARVRASIESDFVSADIINWHALQCEDIIRHLALCGLSHLSEHAPKLLKEIGGRAPPILDYDSEQTIVRDFMHIMDVYTHLYRDSGNKPYYPFFIAKIVSRRFKGNSEIHRILQYVSRQGHDTVDKNDRIYERICQEAPPQYDLVYEPEVE